MSWFGLLVSRGHVVRLITLILRLHWEHRIDGEKIWHLTSHLVEPFDLDPKSIFWLVFDAYIPFRIFILFYFKYL